MTANLWEWNWNSIAKRVPAARELGYDGVQVAPPQNSVKRTALGNGSDAVLHPWWEVYQPVDYDLTSRMGNEQQFKDMVKTAARKGQGLRRRGDQPHDRPGQHLLRRPASPRTTTRRPYGPTTSTTTTGECPSGDGGIQDFNNKHQVFKCNLVGLEDLEPRADRCRPSWPRT